MSSEMNGVPEPTLRRLPHYYHFLKRLQENGRDVVSCTHIGNDLKLDPTQVRKDLAYTGIVGRPKVGYDVDLLIESIEEFLGWNNVKEAFLVGVGSLGTALIGYAGFRGYGLNIVAAFDQDEKKVGKKIHGLEILPIKKLVNLAQRMKIHLGVLTVPAECAQQITDLMIDGGIQGIWNFAPVNLNVPTHVVVQNENLASGLSVLSKKLTQARHQIIHP